MIDNLQEMQQEQERMEHVQTLIEKESERLENEYEIKLNRQKQLLKESANMRITTCSMEAILETSGELRLFEQDLAIKSNELNQVQTRIAILEKMQEEPYFGRIDYHEVKEPEEEQIYIGIGSLFDEGENWIVDWRAPIASLYYEGNIGDQVKLRFGEHTETFVVDLKRQFRVKEGKIAGMIDTDNVMGDPYLLEVLEGGSSSQMGAVVATLQKEQNQIVRETSARNVLIQGVAGSGKTVVMMQKIAYLLYAFKNTLRADEILLFSPNRIFQDYISQVLPSLGEWDVAGNTYSQFIQKRMPNIEMQTAEPGEQSRAAFLKGSLEFYQALERYAGLLKKKHLRFAPILFREEVLISAEEIEEMYAAIQSKGSLAAKIQILNAHLLARLDELKAEALEADWVEDEMQHLSADALHQLERETHTIVNMEGRMRKEIVEKAFRPIERRVENQTYLRYKNQYIHFLKAVPQLMDLDEFRISKEEWQAHLQETVDLLRENKLFIDDLSAFYALQLQMKGMVKQQAYQYICMDEIQDFTPFQLQLLRKLYPRARYVMAGDLNQNIWQNHLDFSELEKIFEGEEIKRQLLLTSYRSTKEIMGFADQFITLTDRKAAPVRSRKKPEMLFSDKENYLELLHQRIQAAEERDERIAFLAPSVKAAEAFTPTLDELGIKYQTIYEETDSLSDSIVVMPIGLAKGLEFDAVFAIALEEAEQKEEKMLQIWYTIFSRAMHELYVLLPNEEAALLQGVRKDTYETAN